MKCFKYLKFTPFAQIQTDWSEYMYLRSKCSRFREKDQLAYSHLVSFFDGYHGDNCKKSCVMGQCVLCRQPNMNDGIDNNLMSVQYSLCDNFDDTDNCTKCSKLECRYVQKNREYMDIHKRYCELREEYRNFWRNKFEQAHKKTK